MTPATLLEENASTVLARATVSSGSLPRTRIEASAMVPLSFALEIPGAQIIRISVLGEEPSWLSPALGKLRSLTSLPRNWDSYDGVPVTFEAALATLQFMFAYSASAVIEPSIVPSSSGGVQLEWHRVGGDLEVNFSSDGELSTFFVDGESGEEWEMENDTIDPARIRAALARVTVP